MTKKIENQTLHVEFEVVEELTQGMLENFEQKISEDRITWPGQKSLYSKFLRCAIAVGWVKSGPIMQDAQIIAADPRIVAMIGAFLVDEYNKASIVPNP
jgi:hypothetical protein